MQAATACLPGDVGFLKMVREETKSRGITMIFDEVMTSRLAPVACRRRPVSSPDMTTLGNISAAACRRRLRRPARHHGAVRPHQADTCRTPGTFNTTRSPWRRARWLREVYNARGGQGAERARREDSQRLNAICAGEGGVQFSGIGSMMTAHATARPIKTAADIAIQQSNWTPGAVLLRHDGAGIWIARRGFVALTS